MTFACGPFSLSAVFTFTVHPEYPLENFARGDLGVVSPSFARSYLYVAYHYLNGAHFNAAEQEALVELWRDRIDLRWPDGSEQAVKVWTEARQKVLPGPAPKIEVYRNREKPNEYDSYLNCQNDAFETAATTLEDRIKRFGSDSAPVKQWVEAQDQVFLNCSEGQHIPAALPAEADPMASADRDYQTAAANFYAGNFDAAATQFAAIAASPSPWHAGAPYLVARTLLRKASLGADETKKATLAEAEEQLNKVLKDSKLQPSHAAAKRLLSIVRIRLHPEERLHELGLQLAGKSEQPNLKQDLWDYTILLDQLAGDDSAHHQKTTASVDLHGDDLTDWIVSFQDDKAEAADYSLTRWQSTASLPWLIAALAKVEPQDPKAKILQDAAERIPPASPAFATVSYFSVRLDIVAGRSDQARTKLDNLLRAQVARFNPSSQSLLRQERMAVSSSLEDFLTYAQRVPVGFSWDEDGREIPADDAEVGEELSAIRGKPLFDEDAAEILVRRMPLSLLSQAATNNQLPDHLQRDLTQATWLRAILLGDHTTATALVPQLKARVPDMAPLLDAYVNARGPEAKKFAALYAWLKFPGLEPVVDSGIGRIGPLDNQDSYRDNWWCSAPLLATAPAADPTKPGEIPSEKRIPTFLTPAQRATAEREFVMLGTIGATPNYLSREILAWAAKNPTDPRVPEALHRAVKTTRYGCGDKQSGKWSKAAYDFLHQRYPNNTWTKQTPYWFKE